MGVDAHIAERPRSERRGGAATRGAMSAAETLLWCAASAVIGVALTINAGGPVLFNDSYQYVSAAEHIAARGSADTSIVYFDVERASGTIPAPLTTFPPGYPAVIAGLSFLGLNFEWAGLVCSLFCYVLMVPLTGWAARQIGLGAWATRFALLWLLGNAYMARHSVRVMSEPLFTAVSLGALVLLMRYERRSSAPHHSPATGELVAGCVLVGLAYWVRYVGLLLFGAVLVFYGSRLLIDRHRRRVTELSCVAIAAAIIGVGVVRNLVLTGTWKGGNDRPVSHELMPIAKKLLASVHHLFLGKSLEPRLAVAGVAVMSAAGALLGCVLWLRRAAIPQGRTPLWLLGSYLFVYTAGMFYVGVSSCVAIVMRMFYPVLPVMILLMTAVLWHVVRSLREPALWRAVWPSAWPSWPSAWPSVWRRVAVISAAVMTAGYLLINGAGMWTEQPAQPHHRVEARLTGAPADGRSLRAWIDAHIPEDAVVVASDAQATAHALGRRTVGLIESRYSVETWDAHAVFRLMQSYGAEYLILYPNAHPQTVPAQAESRFLRQLLRNNETSWLVPAAENDHVRIFRLQPAPARVES